MRGSRGVGRDNGTAELEESKSVSVLRLLEAGEFTVKCNAEKAYKRILEIYLRWNGGRKLLNICHEIESST